MNLQQRLLTGIFLFLPLSGSLAQGPVYNFNFGSPTSPASGSSNLPTPVQQVAPAQKAQIPPKLSNYRCREKE